jgi:hypothetical protein
MIPSIETIVEGLLDGTYSKQQAIAWLNQHAEDAGYCLRDQFAGQAIAGRMTDYGSARMSEAVNEAYQVADAMLKAREA